MVDRLKKEYAGRVDVRVYVDSTEEGDPLAVAFGVEFVPTFVFINSDGTKADQHVGSIPEADLRKKMDALK